MSRIAIREFYREKEALDYLFQESIEDQLESLQKINTQSLQNTTFLQRLSNWFIQKN